MLVMRCDSDTGAQAPSWQIDRMAGEDGVTLCFMRRGDTAANQAIADLAKVLGAGKIPWLSPRSSGGWVIDFDAMRSAMPGLDLPSWAVGNQTVEPTFEITPIMRERVVMLRVTARAN